MTGVQTCALPILTRVPGVGEKSAKRLIVELKEKVAALGASDVVMAPVLTTSGSFYQDALEALLSLGYNGTEAQSALQTVSGYEQLRTEELLRKALARLGAK